MATTDREQQYITAARDAARDVWEGFLTLKSLQTEWNAQNYGVTLDDGTNENAGILASQVGAAVFGAADALEDLINGTLDSGNLPGAIAANLSDLL